MITEERTKHIMAVAQLMADNAEKVGLDKEEMYLLGYVHDIGYALGDAEEHHIKGGECLSKSTYKYYKEVLYHGKPVENYSSVALDLLNYADMHINKKGEYVTFEERLEDIAKRRGTNSPHYINCKKIIDGLNNKHFLSENVDNVLDKQ